MLATLRCSISAASRTASLRPGSILRLRVAILVRDMCRMYCESNANVTHFALHVQHAWVRTWSGEMLIWPPRCPEVPELMPIDPKTLFSYTFRPFFLLAGLWAILAVVRWMLILNGVASPPFGTNPVYWHGHEMIVGFALAVVAGFVLSAVATWTGRPAINGSAVVWLVVSWLLGRLAIYYTGAMPVFVTALLDMLFPVTLSLLIGREVFGARNKRNYKVVAITVVLAAVNLLYHLGVAGIIEGADYIAIYLLIHGIIMLVALIGGRVVPSFTANWLRGQGVTDLPKINENIDRMAITVTILVGLAVIFFPDRIVIAYLAASAAVLHGVRVAQWRGLQTTRNPLLFVMHVAYWWLPIGYTMMSLASFGWAFTPTAALHALTMGGIGGMIMAMITRVPLGHTGRALHASRLIVAAYAVLMLAVVVRVLSPWNADSYLAGLNLAAAGWCLAFAIFLWVYWPVLTQPSVKS